MSGGARARQAFLPFAAAYSVLYGLAVGADHLTTTEIIARGGVETNFILASADGALAEARAILLFLWLFPAMLWLCWLGYRRLTGHAGARRPLVDALLGGGPAGVLLIPVTVVTIKAVASVHNLAVMLGLGSGPGLTRALLGPEASPRLVYLATAGAMLGFSLILARPLACRLAQRFARREA